MEKRFGPPYDSVPDPVPQSWARQNIRMETVMPKLLISTGLVITFLATVPASGEFWCLRSPGQSGGACVFRRGAIARRLRPSVLSVTSASVSRWQSSRAGARQRKAIGQTKPACMFAARIGQSSIANINEMILISNLEARLKTKRAATSWSSANRNPSSGPSTAKAVASASARMQRRWKTVTDVSWSDAG